MFSLCFNPRARAALGVVPRNIAVRGENVQARLAVFLADKSGNTDAGTGQAFERPEIR